MATQQTTTTEPLVIAAEAISEGFGEIAGLIREGKFEQACEDIVVAVTGAISLIQLLGTAGKPQPVVM